VVVRREDQQLLREAKLSALFVECAWLTEPALTRALAVLSSWAGRVLSGV
jgi:hypothetical protein